MDRFHFFEERSFRFKTTEEKKTIVFENDPQLSTFIDDSLFTTVKDDPL